MVESFGSGAGLDIPIGEAKITWADTLDTLKTLDDGLGKDYSRNIASLLYQNEERMADHCENMWQGGLLGQLVNDTEDDEA